MADQQYLFVYGSLMSSFKTESYQYMMRYFQFVGKAHINATMYDMDTHPVVKLHDTGNVVHGELYAIKNKSEFSFIIAQLDDYEGLHPEEGEETFFERKQTTAFINNEAFPAWVYEYNREITDRPIVPNGDSIAFLNNR